MSMTIYDFTEQLEKGAEGEARLDAFFSKWYVITPASAEGQRAGIDRYFAAHATPARRFAIEYKTDSLTAKTGNVFIETVSVSGQKAGWAYTSRADYLIYFIPAPERILVVGMEDLRSKLSDWLLIHKRVSVKNRGYTTKGVLVPLPSFAAIAAYTYGDK